MPAPEQWLTIYGPLALGWPAFFWLLVRHFKLQDKMLDALREGTQAMTRLAEKIEQANK